MQEICDEIKAAKEQSTIKKILANLFFRKYKQLGVLGKETGMSKNKLSKIKTQKKNCRKENMLKRGGKTQKQGH